MGRAPCCSKVGLRRGPWSMKEDTILTNYIQEHGEGQWRSLPKNAGLLRCGKSCRLRWMNYLRPGIKRGNISQDEEDLIVRLHGLLGNRWSLIAGRLPGRTDNEIKNYWNTHLIKKLAAAAATESPAAAGVSKKNPKPPKDSSAPKSKKSRKKKAKKVNELSPEDDQLGPDDDKLGPDNQKLVTEEDAPVKTKVYLPKPIRVSSVFSRTSSYDSLASGTSSSEAAPLATEVASYIPVAWPPLFELEEGGANGDFLGCIMPVIQQEPSDSMSSDVNMWEQMYDEYFQLL